HGGAQGARERLELCLGDVVRVAPLEHPHVQAYAGVEGDRLEHVPGHGTGEVPADEVVLLAGGLTAVYQVGASGNVHHSLGEGLVQWHERIAESGDAAFVPQRLAQGLTDADGGVLHGVVHIHVRITLGAHGQVDQGVLAQGGEHVVVERHGGGHVHGSGAVEIDLHGHGGLRCAPLH